jgi:quercetin dioxygenase-like cupin family protein
MSPSPTEIENAVTGERIVFILTSEQTGGELLEMDNLWARADHRTPEHLHPAMEEKWEVLAGTVCFQLDGVEHTIGAGETLLAAPGTPHSARNVGLGPAHLRIQMRPPLRWQQFVERLFALSRSKGVSAGGGIDPESLAALMAEFEQEIAPTR